MNSYKRIFIAGAMMLAFPIALFARTNCDSQPKPAFDCPTGYSIMCIPTGGDHWGCGKQNADGTFEEASSPVLATDSGTAATTTVATPPEQTATDGSSPSTPEPAATPTDTGTTTPSEPAPQTAGTAPATAPAQGTSLAQTSSPPSSEPVQTTPPPVPSGGSANAIDPAGTDAAVASPDAPVVGSATAVSEPPSLDDLAEAAESLSERAPSALRPVLAAIASTLAAIAMLFGIWEWLRRLKEKRTKTCGRCGGDKTEAEKKVCARCGGKKTIEEEFEVTVKCLHCAGSGIDPCHHCSGSGKMTMPNPPQSQEELEGWPPCDFCGGSGKKTVGAGRDFGEANDAMKAGLACCFCHGKKSETIKKKREVPCPDCAK